MIFNKHSALEGQHAFLGASKYHWINYDESKVAESYSKFLATQKGTELHDFAAKCITLGQKLPKSQKTLNMYVNDAIGFKMTPEQIAEVERLVNEAIEAKAPVICEEMGVEEAKAQGAIGLFGDKYGEKVRVYTMGGFSKEICGGPHAANTGDLEHFRIVKEESSSRGVRRIKAVIGK